MLIHIFIHEEAHCLALAKLHTSSIGIKHHRAVAPGCFFGCRYHLRIMLREISQNGIKRFHLEPQSRGCICRGVRVQRVNLHHHLSQLPNRMHRTLAVLLFRKGNSHGFVKAAQRFALMRFDDEQGERWEGVQRRLRKQFASRQKRWRHSAIIISNSFICFWPAYGPVKFYAAFLQFHGSFVKIIAANMWLGRFPCVRGDLH